MTPAPEARVLGAGSTEDAVRRASAAAEALGLSTLNLTAQVGRFVRHPLLAYRYALALRQLPELRLRLTRGTDGLAIQHSHSRRLAARWMPATARSAYRVPRNGNPFIGRHGHERRRYARRATRGGIVISSVPVDLIEEALVSIGDGPLDCGPCDGKAFVATDAEGIPVAVTHWHVDGAIAQLVRAVHKKGHSYTGPVRYAMFERSAEDLRAGGVEVLLLLENFFTLPAGLREFHRNLGFVPVRLKLTAGKKEVPMWTWR